MKVILINGSPHENGCTDMALRYGEKGLGKFGIHTEFYRLGTRPVHGCIACGACADGSGCCAFDNGGVNEFLKKAQSADGFVFGSPVHYASAAGALVSFMDRCFFAGAEHFRNKPGAAVCALRRGGATATLDQLNKYMLQACMPVVSSLYWNMIHGMTPEEVKKDAEGAQALTLLGENMGWILRCIEAGNRAGVSLPAAPEHIFTNFIR